MFWPSWLHFGSQVGVQVANKTSTETSTETALRKKQPEMPPRGPLIPFWCQLASILAPKRSIFGSMFVRLGVRFQPPRRAQDGPQRPPRPPRQPRGGRQDGPSDRQDGPKRVPKNRFPSLLVGLGRQDAPRPPQDPSKIDF